MEQKFFATEKPIIYYSVFVSFPMVSCIVLLAYQEWWPAVTCFAVVFISLLFLAIWRELFFAKISLSENGISKVFGKKVINSIAWENLVEVRALSDYFLYFLDEKYDKKVLNNYKTNICLALTSKKLKILLQFKDKFQDKIIDITILSWADQVALKSDSN